VAAFGCEPGGVVTPAEACWPSGEAVLPRTCQERREGFWEPAAGDDPAAGWGRGPEGVITGLGRVAGVAPDMVGESTEVGGIPEATRAWGGAAGPRLTGRDSPADGAPLAP